MNDRSTGDDVVHGGTGNDLLVCSEGDDRLFGGAGRDILIGAIGTIARTMK